MGYALKRRDHNGRNRYTAIYLDDRADRRSAGTFTSKKEADKAWQRAQAKVDEGRGRHLTRGRQQFRRYVEETWLPNHVMEVSTRESYTYSLYAHIIDYFGPLRMKEIMPSDVRAWITSLQAAGMNPPTIDKNKTILSAIFTTAFTDEVVAIHPVKGVKVPPSPAKPLKIITPEQFDQFYRALPDDMSKLLAEVAIETGMRSGELTELRPKDLDFTTRFVTVNRAVVEVTSRFHPEGGRFLVKDYPKDGEYRRFKISPQLATKINTYIEEYRLAEGDLLFYYEPAGPAERPHLPDPATLGLTEPNAAGRRYQHGTTTAYCTGRCRCRYCRTAIATYRANRRAAGQDRPTKDRPNRLDGHLPHARFRDRVIKPALKQAGLTIDIRMHMLRHAHASWLLAGGADLQTVKQRLGHSTIRTTERYLHTLDDTDETALDAFNAIRHRSTAKTESATESSTAKTPAELVAEMSNLQAQLTRALATLRSSAHTA